MDWSFSQNIVDGLVESEDWPRLNLYLARWGKPIVSGIPEWYAENGSGNHKIQFLAASVIQDGLRYWEENVNDWLDRLLKYHNLQEQLSAIYDTYYLASVCAFDFCAKRDGFPEIREKCRQYFQNTVNLWSALRDSRGRVIAPGKRTSPEGHDVRRDQCLRLLRGERRLKWPDRRWNEHFNMEVGLVAQWAEIEHWRFKPESVSNVGLLDPVTIKNVSGGFIATSPILTRCYGFPTWCVWSVGNKLGSVSWKDLDLTKERAKKMGSGQNSLDISIVSDYKKLIPNLQPLSIRVLR